MLKVAKVKKIEMSQMNQRFVAPYLYPVWHLLRDPMGDFVTVIERKKAHSFMNSV